MAFLGDIMTEARTKVQNRVSGHVPSLREMFPVKLDPIGERIFDGAQKALDNGYLRFTRGDITPAEWENMKNSLIATAQKAVGQHPDKSFGEHLVSVAQPIVGAVGGLLKGGPVGAVTGFVAGAKTASEGGAGIVTGVLDTSTPPIVPPGNGVPVEPKKGVNPLVIGGVIVLAVIAMK